MKVPEFTTGLRGSGYTRATLYSLIVNVGGPIIPYHAIVREFEMERFIRIMGMMPAITIISAGRALW